MKVNVSGTKIDNLIRHTTIFINRENFLIKHLRRIFRNNVKQV